MTYLPYAVIVLLIIVHYFERKDLYNRIMSRDFTEYKNKSEPIKRIQSAHERTLQRWRSKEGEN